MGAYLLAKFIHCSTDPGTVSNNLGVSTIAWELRCLCVVFLEIGVSLWSTFILTLFATLPRNHKTYRNSNCACGFCKCAVIKYHQLLSKLTNIKRKSHFDQSATAFSSTCKYFIWITSPQYNILLILTVKVVAYSLGHYEDMTLKITLKSPTTLKKNPKTTETTLKSFTKYNHTEIFS